MKYKTQVLLWIVALMILAIFLSWLTFGRNETAPTVDESSVSHHVIFNCSQNRQIQATFGDDYVRLKLGGGRHFMLKRAVSASGARYKNKDGHLVFWNKGNTAFITRNDTTWFSHCVQKGQDDLVNLENYEDKDGPFHFRYPRVLQWAHKNVKDTTGWSYASSKKGDLITQLNISDTFTHKTNLIAATFSIGQSKQKDALNACLKPAYAPMVYVDSVKKAGQLFVRSHYSDAGAGNMYDIKQYRTLYHKSCYSIEEMVHTTHVQNYPPERGITAFDSARVWKALNVPWETFSFGKTK